MATGRLNKSLDQVIRWGIVLLPFSMAISPAPMNVFTGLIIVAFLAKKALKREVFFPASAVNIALALFFIFTCLSLFNSISYKDSLRGGIFRLLQYIMLFFVVFQEVKDKRHIKEIFFSVCLGLILVSIDGIWQVFKGNDFIRGYVPVLNLGMVRATASFKDPNTLGIYLSGLSPLVFGMTICYFRDKIKIFLIPVSLLFLAGIALTYSRPTLLAAFAAILFLSIAGKKKPLIILLISLVLISPFLLPKSVKEWAREVGYNPVRFMCNDDRIAVYRNSWNMIKAHPFIGVGANTYMKNYKQYREAVEYRNIVTKDGMYAHNNFIHMAAELGLLGLSVFLWLIFKLFKESSRIYLSLKEDGLKWFSLSVTACLLAFLVNGLTESSLYSSRVAPVFWYLMGLGLALAKFKDAEAG